MLLLIQLDCWSAEDQNDATRLKMKNGDILYIDLFQDDLGERKMSDAIPIREREHAHPPFSAQASTGAIPAQSLEK